MLRNKLKGRPAKILEGDFKFYKITIEIDVWEISAAGISPRKILSSSARKKRFQMIFFQEQYLPQAMKMISKEPT